jgi:hypothetical protein
VDGAATVWPVLALCAGRRFVGLAYSGVKQALLVLPFCFVTFILGKQNKSKDGLSHQLFHLL